MLSIRTDWAVLGTYRPANKCALLCDPRRVLRSLVWSQHPAGKKRSKDHMCLAATAVFPHVELPLSSLLLKSFDRRYLLVQSVEAPGRSKFGIRPERSISSMPGPGN